MFGVSDRLVQDSDTFVPRPSAAAAFLNNELRSRIFMGKDQTERLKELVSLQRGCCEYDPLGAVPVH